MGKTTTRSAAAKAAKAASASAHSKATVGGLHRKDLQRQCEAHGLDATGTVCQLKDRLLEHMLQHNIDDAKNETKKAAAAFTVAAKSKTGEAIAKELLCPITLALPFDPVTAEDGRVYERHAIQTHIDNHSYVLKSQITNEVMGKKLFPNPQVKNIIESANQNGDIVGDLACRWKEKQQKKEQMGQWKKEALAGDGTAALEVAKAYYFGTEVIPRNQDNTEWWKLAAEMGNSFGLLMYGRAMLKSTKAEERGTGVSCLTEAAAYGNSLACLYMGRIYSDGDFVERNPVQAARFLRKGLDIQNGDHPFVASRRGRQYYQRLLEALAAGNPRAASFLPSTNNVATARAPLRVRFADLDLAPRLPGSFRHHGQLRQVLPFED